MLTAFALCSHFCLKQLQLTTKRQNILCSPKDCCPQVRCGCVWPPKSHISGTTKIQGPYGQQWSPEVYLPRILFLSLLGRSNTYQLIMTSWRLSIKSSTSFTVSWVWHDPIPVLIAPFQRVYIIVNLYLDLPKGAKWLLKGCQLTIPW